MIAKTFASAAAFVMAYLIARGVSASEREGSEAVRPVPGSGPSAISALPDKDEDSIDPPSFDGLVARMRSVDAHLAAGRFEAVLEGGLGTDRLGDLAMAWAKADPAGLWAWLQSGGQERLGTYRVDGQLFEHWFIRDPEAAMVGLRDAIEAGSRSALSGAFSALFGDDADAAQSVRDHIGELMEIAGDDEFLFINFVVDRDRLEIARTLPESMTRDRLIRGMATRYFDADWKAAIEWSGALPESERKSVELAFMTKATDSTWRRGEVGVEEKLAWAAEWLAAPGNRASLVKHGHQVASKMTRFDVAGAIKWAGANLDGKALVDAVGGVIREEVRKNPTGAIDLIETLPAGGVRREAVGDVVQAYAQADPRTALDWALREHNEMQPLDSGAWTTLGSALGFYHPDFTRELLGNADSEAENYFGSSAVRSLARSEPEKTANWAKALDGERGGRFLNSTLATWRREDKEAAAAWEAAQ